MCRGACEGLSEVINDSQPLTAAAFRRSPRRWAREWGREKVQGGTTWAGHLNDGISRRSRKKEEIS